MIISHKHRFIFLHCRKTGGSSIKVSLYPQLGRQDIMIGSFHELIRDKQQLKMQAISDIVSPSGSTMLLLKLAKTRRIDVSINDAIKSKYNFLGSNPPHASAKLIRENFPAQWQNYQKFAFVRNPYTQIVSDFLWRKKKTKCDASFSDFVDMIDNRQGPMLSKSYIRNWDIISLEDHLALDFVGRFENLYDDLSKICEKLSLKEPLEKHQKIGSTPLNEYGSLYSESIRKKVYKIFESEFETFKYAWPFS